MRTFEFGESPGGCELVAFDDFTWVKAHDQEVFGFLEHLPGEDHDAVGSIPHLFATYDQDTNKYAARI